MSDLKDIETEDLQRMISDTHQSLYGCYQFYGSAGPLGGAEAWLDEAHAELERRRAQEPGPEEE